MAELMYYDVARRLIERTWQLKQTQNSLRKTFRLVIRKQASTRNVSCWYSRLEKYLRKEKDLQDLLCEPFIKEHKSTQTVNQQIEMIEKMYEDVGSDPGLFMNTYGLEYQDYRQVIYAKNRNI